MIGIYKEVTGKEVVEIEKHVQRSNPTHEFKYDLSDRISEKLEPVRISTLELLKNKELLIRHLETGRERAMEITSQHY